MSQEPPTCPDCGAEWVRTGSYFSIMGQLQDLRVTEAADRYLQNPEQYDDRTVQAFKCGNKVVVDDE